MKRNLATPSLILKSPFFVLLPIKHITERSTVRITLSELKARESTSIDLLEIMSLEGQRYMARLHINDEMVVLSDNDRQTLLFRSSWEVQDTLGGFEFGRTELVHPSAYHEMIGMDSGNIQPMRIRIQGQKT